MSCTEERRKNEEKPWIEAVLQTHRLSGTLDGRRRVSVVCPYYERPNHLLNAVAGILNSKNRLLSPDQLEVVVIDDGSKQDGVCDLLPPSVVYLWQKKFVYGLSRSRNLGARVANGEYIFYIDSDLVIEDGYFDAALSAFESYGKRLIQTSYIFDYSFPGSEDPRALFGVWDNPDRPTHRFMHLAGGAMAIHRDLFFEVGGFDEDLVYGGYEDLLFGHRVGHCPDTAILFNAGMRCRHLPHPPSPRVTAPDLCFEICRLKHPAFARDFALWPLM